MLRWIYPDAEDAHHAGTATLKALYSFGIHPRERNSKAQDKDAAKGTDLSVEVFGHKLQNPIGTSAGIDKLAEIPDALLALGPAIVEVGGATARLSAGWESEAEGFSTAESEGAHQSVWVGSSGGGGYGYAVTGTSEAVCVS